MSRPFAVIGFTAFLTAALLYNKETGVTAAVLAVYAAALVVALFNAKARSGRSLPCAFAAGAVTCALLISSNTFLYAPVTALNGTSHQMTAVLTSEPELEYGNCYYTARATQIDGKDVDLKIRLTFSSHPEASEYDEISGNFMFYIPGSSNDDFIASYKANGIYIAAYPERDEYTVNNIPENEKPIGKKIIDVRKAIRNSIYRVLPDERGALAVALIIGDKSGIPADILSDFRNSGISHLICVSGFHLSLWSMFVLEILRKLRISGRISSVICMLAVIGFMAVSGFTYSVIRSGIMMLIFLLSSMVLRKVDSLNSLGFALTAMTVADPFSMGSISLQLSVLSTLGIILYTLTLAPKIKVKTDLIDNKHLRRSVKSFVTSLMVTLSATSFSMPVSLNIYGNFNFAVFGANLVAGPISSASIIINSIGAFLGNFLGNSINLAGKAGGVFCSFLIRFSNKVADMDFLSFRVEKDESALIVCAVLAVVLFSLIMACSGKVKPVLTCILCGAVFVSSLAIFSVSDSGITRIRVVDCGNGTSVLISKRNENLLVGCGGTAFLGGLQLCGLIDDSGGSIDAIFLPYESEHTSSYLLNVLEEARIEKIYCGNLGFDSKLLLKEAEEMPISADYLSDNFTVESETVDGKTVTKISSEDASVLVCYDPIKDFSLFPQNFQSADVIITRGDYPEGVEYFGSDLVIINAENMRGKIIADELVSQGITAVATAENGSISVKADSGFISAHR